MWHGGLRTRRWQENFEHSSLWMVLEHSCGREDNEQSDGEGVTKNTQMSGVNRNIQVAKEAGNAPEAGVQGKIRCQEGLVTFKQLGD